MTRSVRRQTDGDGDERTPRVLKRSQSHGDEASRADLTIDEMVRNSLTYLLTTNKKRCPVRKSELLNLAMNGQRKQFNEVMSKLSDSLDDVFGFEVVRVENVPESKICYIPVSRYRFMTACGVTSHSSVEDIKLGLMYLILTISFMHNKALDEDAIWKIMTEMEYQRVINGRRDNLRQFLKTEYVSCMYLSVSTVYDTEDCPINQYYGWGPRAEVEVSKKWDILKFVAEHFPGTRPEDFHIQFTIAMWTEKDIIEDDLLALGNPTVNSGTAKNGSAVRVTRGHNGAPKYTLENGLPAAADIEPEPSLGSALVPASAQAAGPSRGWVSFPLSLSAPLIRPTRGRALPPSTVQPPQAAGPRRGWTSTVFSPTAPSIGSTREWNDSSAAVQVARPRRGWSSTFLPAFRRPTRGWVDSPEPVQVVRSQNNQDLSPNFPQRDPQQ